MLDSILHCGIPVILEEGCWRCSKCSATGCDNRSDFIKAMQELQEKVRVSIRRGMNGNLR